MKITATIKTAVQTGFIEQFVSNLLAPGMGVLLISR